MEDTINQIAQHINDLAKNRSELAKLLKKVDSLKLFPSLAKQIKPIELNNKICGVDGGFLAKEYHGMGLILRRAVAACFHYKQNKLVKTDYFPSRRPQPEPIIIGSEFNSAEFSTLASLRRVEMELATQLKAAKELQPDVLVADGSIVLHPSSVPDKDSKVQPLYEKVINQYIELYEYCTKNNILLIGAIEDCKGTKYCSLLKQRFSEAALPEEIKKELSELLPVLDRTTDTLFLFYFLQAGWRTEDFEYSSSRAELPVMREIGKWSEAVRAMYIKAVEYDRPMRLDFIGDPEQVASTIFEISRQNRSYSYPSVLIEADGRAKLREQEIMVFKSALNEKLGRNPSLFELRREIRPF